MTVAIRVLIICSGVAAGFVVGMGLAFLFSPVWPLTIVMILSAPLGWYFSHRPWHGRRKSGEFRRTLKALYGPPLTPSGRDLLVGTGIGFPTGFYVFGKMVWSA